MDPSCISTWVNSALASTKQGKQGKLFFQQSRPKRAYKDQEWAPASKEGLNIDLFFLKFELFNEQEIHHHLKAFGIEADGMVIRHSPADIDPDCN